jgi:hypothetical protein
MACGPVLLAVALLVASAGYCRAIKVRMRSQQHSSSCNSTRQRHLSSRLPLCWMMMAATVPPLPCMVVIVQVAAVGDFGADTSHELEVADMVHS